MSMYAYPARVIAHRGGGTLAPENTLAGLAEAHARGYRAVEFDAMLAGDGVPVLMHDDTLDRTTSGRGAVPGMTSAELARLDAGTWRAPRFAGEPVPDLGAAIERCLALGLFANVEIKPWAPGGEAVARATAERVARECARGWRDRPGEVLISSFSMPALEAARDAAPELARACLFDRVPADWRAWLVLTSSVALHCNARHLDAATARAIRDEGFALMCWTVNDTALARRLFGWGVDAICTDRLDLFARLAAGAADW